MSNTHISRNTHWGFWKSRSVIRKFPESPHRTSLYEDWLRAQPAAYRAQLWAAEKEFADDHAARLSVLDQVFQDSMEGYEDAAVGTRATAGFELDSGTDWSWKPHRDQALGYDENSTFKTFRGVPKSSAELYRGEVFSRA